MRFTKVGVWVLAAALCVLGPNGRVLASIPQHLTGGVASAEPAGPDVAFGTVGTGGYDGRGGSSVKRLCRPDVGSCP